VWYGPRWNVMCDHPIYTAETATTKRCQEPPCRSKLL